MANNVEIVTVISNIVSNEDSDTLKGFVIVDGTGNVQYIQLDMLDKIIEFNSQAGVTIKFTNATYNKTHKTLEGTHGSLFKNYPKINERRELVSNNGLTVLYNVKDKTNDTFEGVVCFNALGTRLNLTYKKLKSFRNMLPCNYVMATLNGEELAKVRDVNGNAVADFPYIYLETTKVENQYYRSASGELKPRPIKMSADPSTLPQISIYGFADVTASEINQSAQQKMMAAAINMSKLAPYYHCIYSSINKIPQVGLGTMGVTEDTLYYDIDFVAKLSEAELTFVLIHEVMHLCMLHGVRKAGRNHLLWNIATDLYINTIILSDFELDWSQEQKTFPNKAVLAPLRSGMFLQKVGLTLDLSRETPEVIYEKLVEENPDMANNSNMDVDMNQQPQQGQGQQGQGQGQGQNQQGQQGQGQGQAQQGQGQQGQGQEQQGQGQGQGQSGQGQSGQGQSSQGQSGQGQGQNQQGQQGQFSQGQSGSQSGQGSQQGQQNQQGQNGQDNNGQQNQQQDGQGNQQTDKNGKKQNSDGSSVEDDTNTGTNPSQAKKVTVTYNGKKLEGTVIIDVMTNNAENTKEAKEANMEAAKNMLSKAKTKVQMTEEKLGKKLEKAYGQGGNLVERYIDFGLSSGIDWRLLMKNMCADKPKKQYTFAMPNTDYSSFGMTIAGRHRIGKPTRMAKFIIAVDVSGSVGQADLERYMAEIAMLLKKYEVEAELIYWSTEVGDAGMFSDMRSLLRIKPNTTGGTDVKCVFDYIAGRVKTSTGKVEPLKVKDIKGVFIITDGYFNRNYAEYENHFHKRTVWLIEGSPVNFNPCFGRVLALKFDENK